MGAARQPNPALQLTRCARLLFKIEGILTALPFYYTLLAQRATERQPVERNAARRCFAPHRSWSSRLVICRFWGDDSSYRPFSYR
jgi:hypothetical protein